MPPVKATTPRARPEQARKSYPVGPRIRAARTRAHLTQQQLAGDRYTKAYISALENGLVRPSVAALEYLAPRLGTTAAALLADAQPAWSRVDADLQMASGNWQSAADSYEELLAATTVDKGSRADILTNLAEALIRLRKPEDAIVAASEAVEIFDALTRPADGARASYWLAAGLYEKDNLTESAAILQVLLAKVRTGLQVDPDFKLRLLMAMSSNESRAGNHEAALSYLTEVRALADNLDDRRRAAYLFGLSYSYTETGDYEAAIRTGYAALALFHAHDTAGDFARVENDMALAYLALGNLTRADELARSSLTRGETLGDDQHRAHVLDTQAQIALGRNDLDEAIRLGNESLDLAKEVGFGPAVSDALLTIARSYAAGGEQRSAEARDAFERATADARESARAPTVKRVLTEYADFLANQGDHKAAFELTREALGTSR